MTARDADRARTTTRRVRDHVRRVIDDGGAERALYARFPRSRVDDDPTE